MRFTNNNKDITSTRNIFQVLPRDLQYQVLTFFSLNELSSVSIVCKYWNYLCNDEDNILWDYYCGENQTLKYYARDGVTIRSLLDECEFGRASWRLFLSIFCLPQQKMQFTHKKLVPIIKPIREITEQERHLASQRMECSDDLLTLIKHGGAGNSNMLTNIGYCYSNRTFAGGFGMFEFEVVQKTHTNIAIGITQHNIPAFERFIGLNSESKLL
jgi:hypothetical protein